jgi:hypothetical protein
MIDSLREELANLVFSVPSPYQSLDSRLAAFVRIVEQAERDARRAGLEQAIAIVQSVRDDYPIDISPDGARVAAAARRLAANRIIQEITALKDD